MNCSRPATCPRRPGKAPDAGTAREAAARPGDQPRVVEGGSVRAAHDHAKGLTVTGRYRGRLTAVMAISAGIAAAEIAGALISGSLVLLADAAHMAADAAGVGLSVLAAYVATRPATGRRTFGYARAEILAAPRNALPLLGLPRVILTQTVQGLPAPPPRGSCPVIR